MSTTIEIPKLEQTAICCPHVNVKGNDIEPAWKINPDGMVINLDGEHNLLLCQLCWQALRAHVADSYVREFANSMARQNMRR